MIPPSGTVGAFWYDAFGATLLWPFQSVLSSLFFPLPGKEKTMIKKLSAALLGVAFVLAGCNTVAGVGKDIKAGGEKLERKAEGVKSGS